MLINIITEQRVSDLLRCLTHPRTFLVLFVLQGMAKRIKKAVRITRFTSRYYTPNRTKFFGSFFEFVATMRLSVSDGSISEAFLEWRMNKLKEAEKQNPQNPGVWVFKTLPWRQLLYVTEPEMVQFLTNINPAYVTKGGFTEDVLLTDKNGFTNGLVMLEHEAWHKQRKVTFFHVFQ